MYSCIPNYLSSSVQNGVSPVSPLFQPLQACLAHLQFPRKNISYKELIGEGAFGEVYLGEITGLVRSGKTINLVAVKQLRCKNIYYSSVHDQTVLTFTIQKHFTCTCTHVVALMKRTCNN